MDMRSVREQKEIGTKRMRNGKCDIVCQRVQNAQ